MPRIEPVPWDHLSEEQKREIDYARSSGAMNGSRTSRIFAYSTAAFRAMRASVRALFRQGVIEPRLAELIRLRSANLNGCENCKAARKEGELVSDDDVACIVDPALQGLSERERAAIAFFDRLNDDHLSIDDAYFRELAKVFSTAEIVELGWRSAMAIGSHRFIHCLEILEDRAPVLAFDASQIDRTTAPPVEAAA